METFSLPLEWPLIFLGVTPVTSDASGTFGCGAFCLERGWFQLAWPSSWCDVHIAAKELVPVVVALSLWGHSWQGKCVRFESENMAVYSGSIVHTFITGHADDAPVEVFVILCGSSQRGVCSTPFSGSGEYFR